MKTIIKGRWYTSKGNSMCVYRVVGFARGSVELEAWPYIANTGLARGKRTTSYPLSLRLAFQLLREVP